MSQQTIGVGSAANDGTGDPFRTAYQKCNANFTELYAPLGVQTANTIWAGPTTGGAAAPTFRAMVAADVPSLAASKITSGTVATARLGSGTANNTTFLRGDQTYATPAGVPGPALAYTASAGTPGSGEAQLGGSPFLIHRTDANGTDLIALYTALNVGTFVLVSKRDDPSVYFFMVASAIAVGASVISITYSSSAGAGSFSAGDALSVILGPAGATGAPGSNGNDGAAGQGVPTGGNAGYQLIKLTNTNYDTGWVASVSAVGSPGALQQAGMSGQLADSGATCDGAGNIGGSFLYTPATSGNWASAAPSELKAAVDRLAAWIDTNFPLITPP